MVAVLCGEIGVSAVNVQFVSQMAGANCRGVAIQGNFAYVSQGPDLVVLEVSDPSRPRELGRIALLGDPGASLHAVTIQNSLVYVSAGKLLIVDVSDPSQPTLVGEWVPEPFYAPGIESGGWPGNLSVFGSLVCMGGGPGFFIIDVSDPSAPVLQSAYPTDVEDVVLSGTLVYVADFGYGLKIVDVSDPTAPYLRGACPTPNFADALALSGSTAYVADDGRLNIIDVSNAEQPVLRGSSDDGISAFPGSVAVSGSLLYVVGQLSGSDDGYLSVFDVSDPTTAILRADRTVVGGPVLVAASGPLACVSYYYNNSGIEIYDASDPDYLVRIGWYAPPGNARRIMIDGSRACIADGGGGVKSIDVSNPVDPIMEGVFLQYQAATYDAALSGTVAIASGPNQDFYDFAVVDFATPATPYRRYYRNTGVTCVAFLGSLACMGVDASWLFGTGLALLDVSNPSNPVVEGLYAGEFAPTDLAIDNSLAYLAVGGAGLEIVDVSDSTTPVLRGVSGTSGNAVGVAVVSSLAFVANEDSGLQVVDVSNPDAPFLRGAVDTPGSASDVAVSGTLVYVADGDVGVQVIDVSDPDAPILIGSFDTPGDAQGVAAHGSVVCVADGAGGLVILRYVPPTELASWDFAAAGGELTAPNAEMVSGSLRLETTSNSAEFGFWGSSPTAAPIVPDSFCRTVWNVSSNISPRAMVPSMRSRVNASNGQQANLLLVDSTDDGRFSPDADGETYELYFDSPAGVTVTNGESSAYWQFAFDLTNFDSSDASSGWIALDSFAYERLPRPTTATVLQQHDFSGGSEGWRFSGAVSGFTPPTQLAVPGSLGMAATTNTNLYGFYTSAANDALLQAAEPLTRVVFRVRTDEPNASLVPALRLRLNLSIGHEASVLQVDSAGAAANSPTLAGREYSLYYLAPPIAYGEGVTLGFDMLGFDPFDSPTAALYLDDVRVEALAQP